jgi:hypothetical protein
MTFEQVERHNIDQLWLALERCQYLGREAGRRVTLTSNPLADVASGVEQVGAVGQLPQAVADEAAVRGTRPARWAPTARRRAGGAARQSSLLC